ncbi:hypothetical protein ACHAO1_011084 [Botrytis cinerea]
MNYSRGRRSACRMVPMLLSSAVGLAAGNLVRALQQLCQVKCVLYVGKLGSLKSEHIPNSVLATGNTTSVNGANVEWHNHLADILNEDPCVIQGRHKTLPSVLDETKKWLADHIGELDYVDPEIGYMALASIAGGTKFGYLPIAITPRNPHKKI